MRIELTSEVGSDLEKRAAASGMSVADYVRRLMSEEAREGSRDEAHRQQTVEVFLEHMKTSTATLGRDGRDWREFIHEGLSD